MKNKYDFYKENNRWFIDIPEWEGSKEELEMVAGADDLLDFLSGNGEKVNLTLSDEQFKGAETLHRIDDSASSGSYYFLEEYEKQDNYMEMWFCDVTKFVFGGDFPESIFFAKE